MQWFGTGPRAGLRLKKRGGDTVVKPTPTKLIGQGWDEGWGAGGGGYKPLQPQLGFQGA